MARSESFNIDGVTANSRIAASVVRNPHGPALSAKVDKEWITLTYREFEEKVKAFSLGLRALGVQFGDRVALLSENRLEWAIADVAILATGAITVPIYSTLPPAQVTHILADSGARGIIASDMRQLSKVEAARSRCPELSIFITMEEADGHSDVHSFQKVLSLKVGDEIGESFEVRRASVRPSDLASLVYTSGTTGEPKGTMLSHQNFAAAINMAEIWFPVQQTDTFLSFLPLCHVFERVTHYLSLSLGTHTYYAESIFKVADNIAEVRPVIMQSVPRLFETIHERVSDTVAKRSVLQQRIFHWALSVGKTYSDRRNSGSFISPLLSLRKAFADRLVLSKVRQRFGGRLRFFVSGGAPLAHSTADFFNSIDIPILEGYGMTETTAPLTCNPYHRSKIGTVGKAFAAVQLKIADDGEILAKGPNIMAGYWANPGATHEMFTDDAWLRTGDIGKFDSSGYLTITDRKKDIIVLANGKNVAPQPIENLLKQSPLISEIVLLGDKAGTVAALVLPNYDKLTAWAKEAQVIFDDRQALASTIEAKRKIKQEIDKLSTDLAEFEKVRKIALLVQPLTIDSGELTPTMKVKRKVVYENHGHLLD